MSTPPAASGAAPADIRLALAQFEDMVRRNAGGDRSDVAVSKARDRLLAALASREASRSLNPELLKAYELGFLRAAEWVNRDDLRADLDSGAYEKDRLRDLGPILDRAALASPQVAPVPYDSAQAQEIMADLRDDIDEALAAPVQVAPASLQDALVLEGYFLWDGDDLEGYAQRIFCSAEGGDPAHKPGQSDHRKHVWVSKKVYSIAAPMQAPAAADEVPAWKVDLIRSAAPYCLGCEKEGHRTDECWSTAGFNTPRDMEMARLTWKVPVPSRAAADDARDAARYRWLRRQYWDRASLFVVSGGKDSVKLGTYCPTVERLDDLIDAALSTPAAKPAEEQGS